VALINLGCIKIDSLASTSAQRFRRGAPAYTKFGGTAYMGVKPPSCPILEHSALSDNMAIGYGEDR
jgi:hypothetical protein